MVSTMPTRNWPGWWLYSLSGLLCLSSGALAQGLSPMHKEGRTLSDKKLFRITLINPYAKEMRYELSAEDRDTRQDQPDVQFTGKQGLLMPKGQKKVLVLIPVPQQRREVRVCVRFPQLQDSIRPRVCGDFTAVAVRGHERERGVPATATAGRGGRGLDHDRNRDPLPLVHELQPGLR